MWRLHVQTVGASKLGSFAATTEMRLRRAGFFWAISARLDRGSWPGMFTKSVLWK